MDLPRRLDWSAFHAAKRRRGVSLKALVYRAPSLKLISESSYRRANVQLAEWGNPGAGPLGPAESPSLLDPAAGQRSFTIRLTMPAAAEALDPILCWIMSATFC